MSDAALGVRLAFAKTLLQLFRLSRLYEASNVNLDAPVALLIEQADTAGEAGKLSLQAEGGVIYLNKRPLRGGRQAFNTIQGLVKAFGELGVAELSFALPLEEHGLRAFLNVLRDAEPGQGIKQAVQDGELGERFRVFLPGEATGTADVRKVDIDEDTYFPLAYSRSLILLREYVKNLKNEELARYFSQKLQRAVQELVTMSARNEHRLLALAAVRGADEYQFTHAVNTGLLSLCLGRRLGLTNLQLSDLTYAAFLHGIGRFRTRPDLIQRATLEKDERREYGQHPFRSMGAFLETRQISTRVQIAALVAFQFDLWRRWTRTRLPVFELHPFTKIVGVCELYDSLTSDLDDRPALLPDQAFEQLRARMYVPAGPKADGGSKLVGVGSSKLLGPGDTSLRSGSQSYGAVGSAAEIFDPVVIGAFGDMMGIYPAGTLVELSGGEVAVVIHPNPELLARPLVAVIRDAQGATIEPDYRDLADQDAQGRYRAAIAGFVDGEALGIEIPEGLL